MEFTSNVNKVISKAQESNKSSGGNQQASNMSSGFLLTHGTHSKILATLDIQINTKVQFTAVIYVQKSPYTPRPLNTKAEKRSKLEKLPSVILALLI